MGLTKNSVGTNASKGVNVIIKKSPDDKVIALAGNPNVGKSTVFNGLTGMNQHTGNWPGKTVSSAQGYYRRGDCGYVLVDIPGTYSLVAHSAEEEVARDFICHQNPDAVIVVCDATCLERNLNLALQIMEICPKTVLCVNLMDEAKRKGIEVDLKLLEKRLGITVVGCVARNKKSLARLADAVENVKERELLKIEFSGEDEDAAATAVVAMAEKICKGVVTKKSQKSGGDEKIDRILTGKFTAYPIMLVMLAFIFWLTITAANYPSALLSSLFEKGYLWLVSLLSGWGAPVWLTGVLADGLYRVLSWVVAVMLPPMAIFFPLFTLMEDLGYLPRIAYNLDGAFKRCNACGKQALTMCMGFGCNAAGVVGCRIIDSPRERLLAILTNSLVPCNGRFPALIAIITVFFIGASSGFMSSLASTALLTAAILLGVMATLAATYLLSKTVLKGVPTSFTLELPPYRKPQIGKILVRSVLDRTLFVLGRAAAVAAPAGVFIWIMTNVTAGGQSLLAHCAGFLDPIGKLMGLDGVILMAFILGFPANEIVVPIIIMAYTAQGTLTELSAEAMHALFLQNGWSGITAVCFMLFSLMHWPCSTTLMTVKKETGSLKWTTLAALLPTLMGFTACVIVNLLCKLI